MLNRRAAIVSSSLKKIPASVRLLGLASLTAVLMFFAATPKARAQSGCNVSEFETCMQSCHSGTPEGNLLCDCLCGVKANCGGTVAECEETYPGA